jgi:type II secretory pathway pseudopilin PulG
MLTLMKMKKLMKGEKGLTLLELLVGIGLIALISTGITMVISQTFTGSARSSNHMVAVRQVQEVGYWVSYYACSAQNLTITGDSGFPLILRWIDFGTNTSTRREVRFSLNNSGLRGSYYVDGVLNPVETGKIPVFEVISSNKTKTNCQVSGGSDFSLPDVGDAFKITGGATPDSGIVTPVAGLSFVTAGNATFNAGTGAWTTTATGDTIAVAAISSGRRGSWTSETKAATAAVTVDSGAQAATLSSAKGLVFTVTATVGTSQQQESETRIYKIVPRPAS